MKRTNLSALATVLLCLTAISGFAQDQPQVIGPAPAVQEAPTLKGLQIDAGLVLGLHSPIGTTGYERVTYKSKPVSRGGTLPTLLDATHQFAIPASQNQQSDVPGFNFDLVTGKGTGSGSFFDAIGVNSFIAPRLNFKPFDTTGSISGTLDGSEFNVSLGFQAPPFHLTNLGVSRKANIANWLVVRAEGQQQWQRGAMAKNQTVGQLAYRFFMGKAFDYRPSRRTPIPFTYAELKAKVPTFADMKAKHDSLLAAGPAVAHSEMDDVINGIYSKTVPGLPGEGGPPPSKVDTAENYLLLLSQQYAAYRRGYELHPTYGMWVEGTGRYLLAGDPQGERFKGAAAIVLSYWHDLNNDILSSLQLHYEVGHDQESLAREQHRLILSVGLSF